jgi:exodeoxyribonuclease V alpha subunit
MRHDPRLDLLEQATERGMLRALDVAFARFLAMQDATASAVVPLLGALVSRQQADGHLCLDLTTWQQLADEFAWPSSWQALITKAAAEPHSLTASILVATPADNARRGSPLVLDGDRLYLRRYWNHEQRVAEAIGQRLAQVPSAPAQLAEQLARLFPAAPTDAPDWQRVACALAARGAFTVITGGPGTGQDHHRRALARLAADVATKRLATSPAYPPCRPHWQGRRPAAGVDQRADRAARCRR